MSLWMLKILVAFFLWFATFTSSERVALGSAFLVLVGVVGEYVADIEGIEARKYLHKRIKRLAMAILVLGLSGDVLGIVMGQAEMAALTREAGDAAKSATTAHEEADAVKGIADEARADAKDALVKAQVAQRELAHAEAGAAKAQTAASRALGTADKAESHLADALQRAENAERETARLRQKLADRILSPEQLERIKAKVNLFHGTPYELAVNDVPEATRLMESIDNLLRSAGWVCKPSENKAFRFVFTLSNGDKAEVSHASGVEIALTKSLLGKYGLAAGALQKALGAEGIEATGRILPEDDPSPNAIHITIGSKP